MFCIQSTFIITTTTTTTIISITTAATTTTTSATTTTTTFASTCIMTMLTIYKLPRGSVRSGEWMLHGSNRTIM